jgi:hypothetical protein
MILTLDLRNQLLTSTVELLTGMQRFYSFLAVIKKTIWKKGKVQIDKQFIKFIFS